MPGKHKNPTISFRVSDYERRAIEANIKMSGMLKKDYFIRSCIYNRVCVVGKKETIYPLVEELRKMQEQMAELGEQFQEEGKIAMPEEEFADMQTDYLHMLRAVLTVPRYLSVRCGLPAYAESRHSDAGWCKVSVGGRQRKGTGIKQA